MKDITRKFLIELFMQFMEDVADDPGRLVGCLEPYKFPRHSEPKGSELRAILEIAADLDIDPWDYWSQCFSPSEVDRLRKIAEQEN